MRPELGICMDECAEPIFNTLEKAINPDKKFVYVELGVAEGKTFFGILKFIEQLTPNYIGFGVDIQNGWSLNLEEIEKNKEDVDPARFVISFQGSQDFLRHSNDEEFDYLLIDACHARKCCMNDFLAAESKVKHGGYVVFHDSGEREVGSDEQPHCNFPIDVRGALKDLQFIPFTRPGWEFVADVEGVLGRGCFIVKKL